MTSCYPLPCTPSPVVTLLYPNTSCYPPLYPITSCYPPPLYPFHQLLPIITCYPLYPIISCYPLYSWHQLLPVAPHHQLLPPYSIINVVPTHPPSCCINLYVVPCAWRPNHLVLGPVYRDFLSLSVGTGEGRKIVYKTIFVWSTNSVHGLCSHSNNVCDLWQKKSVWMSNVRNKINTDIDEEVK